MSSFCLKLLALVLMTFDHLYYFFPGTFPFWFTVIGRVSAPLFFFCAAWGIHHTRNRKAYLGRLYISAAALGIAETILTLALPGGQSLTFNIFSTLLCSGAICTLIHLHRQSDPRFKSAMTSFVVWQVVCLGVCIFAGVYNPPYGYAILGLFPSMLFAEGSVLFVLLGVLFYLNKERPLALSVSYCLFSFVFLLEGSYQWIMVFALPFMLLYNRKKGASAKYLFYIYYPLHILALYILSALITV